MVEFRDCIGRLTATGDARTGLVENHYKGQKTKALLRIGESRPRQGKFAKRVPVKQIRPQPGVAFELNSR